MKIRWSCCSGASIIQTNAVVNARSAADAVMGETHRRRNDLVPTKSKSARTDMPAPGRYPPCRAASRQRGRHNLKEGMSAAPAYPGASRRDLAKERPHG